MDNAERIRRIVNNYFQYHENTRGTILNPEVRNSSECPAPGASSAVEMSVVQCDDIFTVFATSLNNTHERSHVQGGPIRCCDDIYRSRGQDCISSHVRGILGILEPDSEAQYKHHSQNQTNWQTGTKIDSLSSNGSSTNFTTTATAAAAIVYPPSTLRTSHINMSDGKNQIRRCQRLDRLQDQDESCHACNGFYGPRYEDPYCSVCHAFLYPNITFSVEVFSHIGQASDSDSGNDEPVDNNAYPNSRPHLSLYYYRNVGAELDIDHGTPPASTNVPVRVDSLADELERLSTPSSYGSVSIEILPPEVLMYTFQYLDELALWCFGQVCSRWKEILLMCVKQDQWKQLFKLRWPLYPAAAYDQVSDWYELYTCMIKSFCCIKCVRQMAAQELPPNWEENQWRKHRLRSELRAMRNDPLDGIETEPLDSSYCHWQATIHGPAGSPYEGGLFFLYIQVPASYPLYPPVVRFLTRVFHPNVSRHGDIGIDSIHHNWSLVFTLSKLLISIQSLLTDPYCDVCMEPEIGELFLTDRQSFNEQAQLWTYKYAMHDMRVF